MSDSKTVGSSLNVHSVFHNYNTKFCYCNIIDTVLVSWPMTSPYVHLGVTNIFQNNLTRQQKPLIPKIIVVECETNVINISSLTESDSISQQFLDCRLYIRSVFVCVSIFIYSLWSELKTS